MKIVCNTINQVESLIKSENIKIVSFDIFDTLLVRPSPVPSDVFFLLEQRIKKLLDNSDVDFFKIRCTAEQEAIKEFRKQDSRFSEINIKQIYDYISAKYQWSSTLTNKIMYEEISLETELLKQRRIGKELFDLALKSGKKVIIVTDMYLDKNSLENILISKGYSGYSNLYVSNEYGERKDTGKLYQKIIYDQKYLPSEILHIGDNYDSDVIMALNSGIIGYYLPSQKDIFFSELFEYKKLWDDFNNLSPLERILLGICINRIADDLYANTSKKNIYFSHFILGFYGLGPVLYSIATYLLNNKDIQKTYSQIHFASRDGYIPEKAYNLIKKSIKIDALETNYIYCSRQSYNCALYDDNLFKYLTSKTNHVDNYSIGNLFSALVESNFLEDRKVDEKTLSYPYNKDAANGFKVLKRLINRYKKDIESTVIQNKLNSIEYFKSNIKTNNSKRAVIFDVGYSGSVSIAIGKLTNYHIDKVYLWETKKNHYYDKLNNTKTYLLGELQNTNQNYPLIDILLEELFSPLEGSCTGYSKENGMIIPNISNDEVYSKSMKEDLLQIQKGALTFIEEVNSIISTLIDIDYVSVFNTFILNLEKSLSLPQDTSVRLLENIKFKDIYSKEKSETLAKKIDDRNDLYFHRTRYLDKQYIASNSLNIIKILNKKIAIHIHLYHIDQSYYIINHLSKAPFEFDLLISVVSEKHNQIVKQIFNKKIINNLNNIITKVLPNRGRDVAPLVIGFKDEQLEYDFVCHIHTKKSQHFDWGNNWNKYLIDNCISPESFSGVIKLFEENEKIGVIFPPMYEGILNFWARNKLHHLGLGNLVEKCEEILLKMSIHLNLDRYNLFFSVGNMFWYKPQALLPLFQLGLSYNDFPKEPIPVDGTLAHVIERLHSIIAEHQGFETVTYITTDYLIDTYVNKNILPITLPNHPINKFSEVQILLDSVIYENIDIKFNQKKYIEALYLIIRLNRINPKNELLNQKIHQFNNHIFNNIKQDNWSKEKSLEAITKLQKAFDANDKTQILSLIDLISKYEPTNIIILNCLTKILIDDNNYDKANEINQLALLFGGNNISTIRLKKLLKSIENQDKIQPNYIVNSKEDSISGNVNIIFPSLHRKRNNSLSRNIKFPLVSIILLSYNNSEYLKEMINSLYKFQYKFPFELIIVDNGSKQDTLRIIKKYKKENIKTIFNKENLGFPKGNNQGILVAEGKYILFANNDIVVTEGWLERMIEIAESDPKIGIVGPISNSVSGVQLDKNAKYSSIKDMHSYAEKISKENKGQVFEFPRVAFLCTLIKKEVIDKIGGLDERFSPGNFEDDDFCLRAQIAGYKTVIAKDVFIHHYGSKSFKADGEKKYFERLEINKKIFIDKWGADPDEIWLKNKPIVRRNIKYNLDNNIFVQSFERALILIEDKDYNIAVSELETAFQNFKCIDRVKYPDFQIDDILNLIGNTSVLTGNLEKANYYFSEELKINPNSSRACVGLAQTYYESELYNESKSMFEWALKYEPFNKNAFKGLIAVNQKLNLNDYDFSLNEVDKPSDYLLQAESLIEQNELDKAIEILIHIIQNNPFNIDALNNLAVVGIMQEKFDEAAIVFERINIVDPGNEIALENMSCLQNLLQSRVNV